MTSCNSAELSALEPLPSPWPNGTEAPRPRRAVALPRDLPARPTLRAPGWGYAASRTLAALAVPLDEQAQAHFVAALVTVLHRYTQQGELALDIFFDGGASITREVRRAWQVDAAHSFGRLRTAVSSGLADRESTPTGCSNVALTIGRFATAEKARGTAVLQDEHELHLLVHEERGHVSMWAAYDASAFSAEGIERLLASLELVLAAGAQDAGCPLHALPLLSPSEALAIVCSGEGPSSDCDDELVHARFERMAQANPLAIAVRSGEHQLCYGELDERASRLAHYLVAQGVHSESAVAVCLPPSIDVLVALLAILKAGGMYVPLDPSQPAALLALVIEDARPQLVLTCRAARAALPASVRSFCFEDDWAGVECMPAETPVANVGLAQACYVVYTSGTTGRPKGVVASHQNLAHYLGVARRRYRFRSDDVFCALARYTFSISFFELLSPLTCGAAVTLLERADVLEPARLAKQLAHVTVLHAGPSLLASLFRHLAREPGRTFPNVRHASSGGEHVPAALLEQMKQVFPRAEIFVIYGCTEISCMGCTGPVSRSERVTRTLVGRPFENSSLRVLDSHGKLVPFGVVGEVYFAGAGLARRYLGRPELTSEKFVAIDGQRFYRTGDLGRLAADGQLELVGRSDFQVQVRGMRVELSGIESMLIALGLAEQCAVVAARHDAGDVRLVAFVVRPREQQAGALRRALAECLPDYMLPQAFVTLKALPLTLNGKLDRRQLEQRASQPWFAPPGMAALSDPEGPTECAVAAAYARVLQRGPVGRDADFFALGGHSLTAVLLAEELAERLGRAVSPALLFEHTTVQSLASALAQDDGAAQTPAPILLSTHQRSPALFMLLGVHLYRPLADALEGHYAVYGVFAASELDLLHAARPECSVSGLASTYVRAIRSQQPRGPYRLGGMSFGGIVAYEAAQQLEAAGEEVELLLLIDSVLPQTRLERARRLLGTTFSELLTAWSRRRQTTPLLHLLGSSRPQGGRSPDGELLHSFEEMRQRAYRAAAKSYVRRARPYGGEVLLVVAGERIRRDPLLDPACGFRKLVANLTVCTLRAGHLALLEQPVVRELAAKLLHVARARGGRPCVVPSFQSASAEHAA